MHKTYIKSIVFILILLSTISYLAATESKPADTVTVNGEDSESCLKRKVPCFTLNMVLRRLKYSSSTIIYVNPGNFTLEYGDKITGMDQLAIIGSGESETVINCHPNTGLYILKSINVTIQFISFVGCGYGNQLEASFNSHVKVHLLPAALSFSSCQNVSVYNVTIQNANGSGLLLHDISRYAIIHNSSISSGHYYWTNSFSSIAVGGIVLASTLSRYGGKTLGNVFINNSKIINNHYYLMNKNVPQCAIQAAGAVTIITSQNHVYINSCVITHNSRGLFVHIATSSYSYEAANTFISQNDEASVIQMDAWSTEITLYEMCIDDPLLIMAPNTYSYSDWSFSSTTSPSVSTLELLIADVFTKIGIHNSNVSKYSFQSMTNNYWCIENLARPSEYNSFVFEDCSELPLIYSSYSNCLSSLSNYSCHDNHKGILCGQCKEGYSVAVNSPYLSCVPCNESLTVVKGWALLVVLEIVPVTIMVIVIAVLNINLNQGSLRGYVFFCQMITIPIPSAGYPSWIGSCDLSSRSHHFAILPFSIWNLGFISFPSCNLFYHDENECSKISICISSNTTPLGAIAFWYIIAFYPFFMLASFYGCIIMYDRGYRCFTCPIRPFHRLMARIWRVFDIRPSLTHTIASIYTLCFTQLTATSVKILEAISFDDKHLFFYDGSQQYFQGYHSAAAVFALVVLAVFIVVPTVYLLVYPFKWFQNCLNRIKFNKDFLIAVTDVFTGPYKDGTQNTWDYRYFVGIYFALQLLLLMVYWFHSKIFTLITNGCLCGLFVIVLVIFRPFKRNIHVFNEITIFAILLLILVVSSLLQFEPCSNSGNNNVYWIVYIFVSYGLMAFVLVYCLVWIFTKCKYARSYYQQLNLTQNTSSIHSVDSQTTDIVLINHEGDEDVFADRVVNPQIYEEHHVSHTLFMQ